MVAVTIMGSGRAKNNFKVDPMTVTVTVLSKIFVMVVEVDL